MLTAKQEMFVKEYLVDLNGTQAAIRAGYSEDTANVIASENLTKPNIQEAIQEAMKKRSEKVEITAEYVLKGIKQVIETTEQDNNKLKGYELLGKHLSLFSENINNNITYKNSPVDMLVKSIEKVKNNTDCVEKSENV